VTVPPLFLQALAVIVAAAIPLTVAVIGYVLSKRIKALDLRHWQHQELTKTRLRYYERIAPLANDIMCYITFIGRWRSWSPIEAIELKRELDREFFSAAPLFSSGTVERYVAFTHICFEHYPSWTQDAKIRSPWGRRKEAYQGDWQGEWSIFFTDAEDGQNNSAFLQGVRERYRSLLRSLVTDIEIYSTHDRYVTSNIRDSIY
jgi:hypothetical protein